MIPYLNYSSQVISLWVLAILGFAFALILTYVSIPSLVTIAKRKSLHATPNGRTSHTGSTPILGGVAIFNGFILSTAIVAGTFFKFDLVYVISGLIILFIAGLKDDILEIHPRSKLAAEITATLLIALLADIRISDFHGLFGLHEIPYLLSILITVFVFIVIINGFNLIDGIDGLAAGVTILTSSVLGIWFWRTGNVAYTIMSFALAGSLVAFFRYNVFGKENKIFMGDTGSLIIGLVMSILTTRFLQLDLHAEGTMAIQSAPAVTVGILIIPLFDTLRVFSIRISQGKSPFSADRQHLHHRLLQLGLTHFQTTLTLLAVNVAFILMCYALQNVGILWLMIIILATALMLSRTLMYFVHKKTAREIIDTRFVTAENLDTVYGKRKTERLQPKEPTVKETAKTTTVVP
jgi:UDP-GlcNAc:undecaprenyl-phosphate/decaprenyl-phosphate GlcNAc-1-phosphate transferase